MDTMNKITGYAQKNMNILVIILALVILGIVTFNTYSLWYIKAQNNIKMGVGMGANVGVDVRRQ